jgi:hypothetical protein
MADLGYSEIETSWLMGVMWLIITLLTIYMLGREGVITRKRVYLILPILLSLSLLPGWWSVKWMAPLLMFGSMLVTSLRFSVLDQYANKVFESKYRATAISALNMLLSVFFVVIVGLSGPIQDAYNTKLIYSLLGLLTILIGLPSGWSLVREYNEYIKRQRLIVN